MSYQGHKNRNHWNVALYMANDYGTYKMVQQAVKDSPKNRNQAAVDILRTLRHWHCTSDPKTPDGAPYTFTSIRAALVGWES